MRDTSDAITLRDSAVALAVTLGIQIFVTFAATATSVLAPELGRDLGVPTKLVGVFVGLVYLGSMAGSLSAGHFIARHGAIRVSQAAVLLCAIGLAVVAATGMSFAALLVPAAMVIGFGYGPITPASSHVLARTTPASRMGLTFSIKQTGVPGGAALAGAVLPALALALGWRAALVLAAGVGIAIAALSQSVRRTLDRGREPHTAPFSISALVDPLRTLLRDRALTELSLAGFVYSAMQVCLMSYLVVYLAEALGFALVAAGLALTMTNVGGIVGRIGWGAVTDRWVRPRRILAALGIASACCAYLVASFDGHWPRALIMAVCTLFGATAIGWNGVQLSEVARQAPEGRAGAITGASVFISFAGVACGPPVFAALAGASGSYAVGFVVFGTANLLFGLALLRGRRTPAARG